MSYQELSIEAYSNMVRKAVQTYLKQHGINTDVAMWHSKPKIKVNEGEIGSLKFHQQISTPGKRRERT